MPADQFAGSPLHLASCHDGSTRSHADSVALGGSDKPSPSLELLKMLYLAAASWLGINFDPA